MLFCRLDPGLVLPVALFRLVLAILFVSILLLLVERGLTFGATMTSASGDNFKKATLPGGAGVTDVTETFAVDVGDRWRVKG